MSGSKGIVPSMDGATWGGGKGPIMPSMDGAVWDGASSAEIMPSNGAVGDTLMPAPTFGIGMGQGQLGQALSDLVEQKDPQSIQTDILSTSTTPAPKPHYYITGVSNPARPWEKVALILGRCTRVPAYVTANPWLSFSGINNSTLRVGMDFGYSGGTFLEITDVKVGEIPIDDLDPSNSPKKPSVIYNLNGSFQSGNSVTLADCDTAWTAATNVVCGTDTFNKKEGTASAVISLGSAFTTGKAAYFPTGSIDIEGYQTITFWIFSTKQVGKNKLSFDLCSDTDGNTSVWNFPFKKVVKKNVWTLISLKAPTPFGSTTIQSIALNCLADPGVRRLSIDKVFLTKDDSGGDFTLWDSDIKQINKDMEQEDAMVERCGQVADEIDIILSFPNGLYSVTTDEFGTLTQGEATVTFLVETRLVGDTGPWTEEDTSWDITKDSAEPFLVSKHLSMAERGRYDVRLTRLTAIGDEVALFDRNQWFALQSVIFEEPYPKDLLAADGSAVFTGRIELAVTATDQVQGTLEPVTATCQSYVASFNENAGVIPIFYQINDLADVNDDDTIVDSAGYTFANHYNSIDAKVFEAVITDWTGSPPYRLNFNGVIWIESPFRATIGYGHQSTTFSGSFIAQTGSFDWNPIFSCGSFFLYQDPSNGDLVLWISSPAAEGAGQSITLAGVADSGDERKFTVLMIENPDESVAFTLSVFDSSDVLIDSDSLSGLTVDDFNGGFDKTYIGTTGDNVDPVVVPVEQRYEGQIWDFRITQINEVMHGSVSGSQIDAAHTAAGNNPALVALHVMRSPSFNPNPIPDKAIDFDSFYQWSGECTIRQDTYDKYIDQPVLLWDLLREIGRCGRATIVKRNGKYAAVMDISRDDTLAPVVQHFSPANSSGFKYRCTRLKRVHAIRVSYTDQETGERLEGIAYNAPYTEDDAINYAVLSLEGAGSEEQAIAYGRMMIAKWELQQAKSYELQTDWEGLLCSEGSLVEVSHDAAMIGIASGYTTDVILDGSDVVGIVVEQGCTFEAGKDYAVRLRKKTNGDTVLADVDNPGAGVYNELTFSNPNPDGDYDFIGDHYQFGEQGLETKLMIVQQIDRLPEHAARLILKEYHEEIYEVEFDLEMELPAYESTATPVADYRFTPSVPTINSITDDDVTMIVTLNTVSTSEVKWLQVQYKKDTDTDWISVEKQPNSGSPTAITLTTGIASGDYDVRARCLSFASVASDWATSTHTV